MGTRNLRGNAGELQRASAVDRAGRFPEGLIVQQTITDDTVVVRKLANGVTVTIERLPHLHSAAAGVWVKTGSANEPDSQAGISHLLEHLFFKGTATRTARELVEVIERQGGQLNAFTSRDYTCVYVKTLDTHIGAGIEILADIIKNSLFCDLEKERNVVLEEIASIEDVPEDYVHERLARRLWPNHPLGRAVSGTVETVAALGLDDVRAYYDAWYRPQNLYFSIAGNFDQDTVLDQVRAEFSALPPGATVDRSGKPEFGRGVELIERNIAQNHLCIGFPGPAITDPRRYVYDVLSSTLGGGSTSRLFERIRENEGLAYAIYSFNAAHLASGMLGVYAAVAPENLAKTIELTFRELRNLRDAPMSDDELDINREQLKGGMLMALEHTSVRMARMARSMMYFGRLITVEEVVNEVDAVTAEGVQALAQDVFTPDTCAMVALGPCDGQVIGPVPL